MTKTQLLMYGHETIVDAYITVGRKPQASPFDIPLQVVVANPIQGQNAFLLLHGSRTKTRLATKLIKGMSINEAHVFYTSTTTKEMKFMSLLEGEECD